MGFQANIYRCLEGMGELCLSPSPAQDEREEAEDAEEAEEAEGPLLPAPPAPQAQALSEGLLYLLM